MIGSWKLVPVEATEEMREVGGRADHIVIYGDCISWDVVDEGGREQSRGDATTVSLAMLQAAPAPPEDVLERMARAYDKAIGISWGRVDAAVGDYAPFVKSRIAAMRAALSAAEETKP